MMISAVSEKQLCLAESLFLSFPTKGSLYLKIVLLFSICFFVPHSPFFSDLTIVLFYLINLFSLFHLSLYLPVILFFNSFCCVPQRRFYSHLSHNAFFSFGTMSHFLFWLGFFR